MRNTDWVFREIDFFNQKKISNVCNSEEIFFFSLFTGHICGKSYGMRFLRRIDKKAIPGKWFGTHCPTGPPTPSFDLFHSPTPYFPLSISSYGSFDSWHLINIIVNIYEVSRYAQFAHMSQIFSTASNYCTLKHSADFELAPIHFGLNNINWDRKSLNYLM